MLRVEPGDTLLALGKALPTVGYKANGSPALSLAPGDLVIVFGYGDGLHLENLAANYPQSRFLVFEPDQSLTVIPDLLESRGDRLTLVRNWEELDDILTKEIVRGSGKVAHVLTTSQYSQAFPKQLTEFQAIVRGARVRRAVIDKTNCEKGHIFLANLADNVPYLLGTPLLTGLKGVCSGLPGFLVGSGPSLERNGACLKEVQGRGLILAAGSAVKPLHDLGVIPDIIVIIEGEDTSDYLEGCGGQTSSILALASEVHPNHFRITGYHTATFHLTSSTAFLFESDDFVPQAGTAGSTAFTLGLLLGLNPLVLLGQDQAFQNGQMHASGTPGDQPLDQDNTAFAVIDPEGALLPTHSAFAASLHWYAESIRYLARHDPERIIINSSEKGAAIPGVPALDLREVIKHHLSTTSRPLDLIRQLQAAPKPDPIALERQVRETCATLGSLSLLLNLNQDQGLEMVNECRSNHPFLHGAMAGLPWNAPVEEIVLRIRQIENTLLKIMTGLG